MRSLRPLMAEDLMEEGRVGPRPLRVLPPASDPAEMYFGRTPSHLSAIPPPRGRPGEDLMDSPLRVEYLDAERMRLVLARRA
jgi:hypothetical protein